MYLSTCIYLFIYLSIYPSIHLHVSILQLIPPANNYNIVLFPWLSSCINRRLECVHTFHEKEQERKNAIIDEQQSFQLNVLQPYFELRSEEQQRQKSFDSLSHREQSYILYQWRSTRKFFTGERGAWSNRFVKLVFTT